MGNKLTPLLHAVTGLTSWPPRRLRLVNLADLDEGLAVRLDDHTAQLMPHGGPRVVEKLIERLTDLGVRYDPAPDPARLYPEAASPIEADVLHAIATAASPAAIDPLADQPSRWLDVVVGEASPCAAMTDEARRSLLDDAAVLDRLIAPPTVVLVGPPNAGKSTLTNRLLGESASVVSDLPGTTRDWVGAAVELASGEAGVARIAVRWLDTPGLRDAGDDAVEARAIAAARAVMATADVVLAIRGPGQRWPDRVDLPEGVTPDAYLLGRGDEAGGEATGDGRTPDRPLRVSGHTGEGLGQLQQAVLRRLGLDRLAPPRPWCFSDTLKRAMQGEPVDLHRYLGLESESRRSHDA